MPQTMQTDRKAFLGQSSERRMVPAVFEPTISKGCGWKIVTSLAVDLRKPQEPKPRLSPEDVRKRLPQSRAQGASALSHSSRNHPSASPLPALPPGLGFQLSKRDLLSSQQPRKAGVLIIFSNDFSQGAQGYYPICPSNSKTWDSPPAVYMSCVKFFRAVIKYS